MRHLVQLHAAGLELTLACPCRCETCGSDAGERRRDELTPGQWISALTRLKRLGCERVSLLGGEPLLYPEWPMVAAAAREQGMDVELITSGIGLGPEVARTIYQIGMASVTVSVDGTETVHDAQRRVRDGFRQALDAIRYLDEAGLRVGVNSQINALSLPTLDDLAPLLESAGALGWQLQLTMPRGRAASCRAIALPPEAIPDVLRTVRRLVARPGLRPFISDNIGYLTKDDPVLRTPPRIPTRCWLGCLAGIRALGIMSDGSVKGCLALPDEAIEGNLLEEPLEEIWGDMSRFAYNRAFDPESLGGACATCKLGRICRGGCTAFAIAVHGRPNVSTHCLRLHGAGDSDTPASRAGNR
jgi:radical SAM protein with 4Fe4S-binding SPASM domain